MPRLPLINTASSRKCMCTYRATSWLPLNLPYFTSVTLHHYQIELLNKNIEPFGFREADFVGITALTGSVYRAYLIAQIQRKQGIPTFMGDIHVSMMPEEALRFSDKEHK